MFITGSAVWRLDSADHHCLRTAVAADSRHHLRCLRDCLVAVASVQVDSTVLERDEMVLPEAAVVMRAPAHALVAVPVVNVDTLKMEKEEQPAEHTVGNFGDSYTPSQEKADSAEAACLSDSLASRPFPSTSIHLIRHYRCYNYSSARNRWRKVLCLLNHRTRCHSSTALSKRTHTHAHTRRHWGHGHHGTRRIHRRSRRRRTFNLANLLKHIMPTWTDIIKCTMTNNSHTSAGICFIA